MLRPAIRVRINRATTAVVVDYAMYNGFFVSTTRGIGYGNNIGNLITTRR